MRSASRRLPDPMARRDWLLLYERGLQGALAARDSRGIAAMIAVLINRFDAVTCPHVS